MHLMQVIKKNKFDAVDLLQIDTEGFDAEIIKMFNFDYYHPVLIQYEHIHLSNKQNNETNKLLSSYGYIIIKKKNDTFAIKQDVITIWLILGYIVLRLYDSITSRIRTFLHKFV